MVARTRLYCYVVRTLHVLFIMPVIDWLDVPETTFRFLVEPWFIMFARMHVNIFVAHSYYNPFTPCEYCAVLLCRSIRSSKEEFVPYLNDYNCSILHVVVLVYCVATWNMHWRTSEFNCH
jgi:hypothetical protein